MLIWWPESSFYLDNHIISYYIFNTVLLVEQFSQKHVYEWLWNQHKSELMGSFFNIDLLIIEHFILLYPFSLIYGKHQIIEVKNCRDLH